MKVIELGVKILVCGGRDYNDSKWIFHMLDAINRDRQVTHLITGDAPGADYWAWQWALDREIPVTQYYADWDKYGRAAGPIRNKQMLTENPDITIVLAFPGGKGTENMLKLAREAGVPEVWYEEKKNEN